MTKPRSDSDTAVSCRRSKKMDEYVDDSELDGSDYSCNCSSRQSTSTDGFVVRCYQDVVRQINGIK
ncbi:MAG: hypothetical protein ACLSGB_08315 [Dorea sp.]